MQRTQPRKPDRRAFPSKRLSDEVHGSSSHNIEMGWLVSYADMMTLLFGLFVMLYVLSLKKHSELQNVLSQVSVKYFDGKAPPQTVSAETKSGNEDDTGTGTDGEAGPLSEAKSQLTQAQAQIQEDAKHLTEQNEKIETLTAAFSALKEKSAHQETKLKMASASNNVVEKLENQLSTTKSELEKANQELTQARSAKNFLMTMVTWDTEHHDIDLKIVTPNAKVFNFKHREVAGEPGRFELDSRVGPGIEMWKAQSFAPGIYRSEMQLYSMNGNNKPAKAHLAIYTNRATYTSLPFALKSVGQTKVIQFQVSEEGDIKIINSP